MRRKSSLFLALRARRLGIALVEAIVVIGILGTLLSFLLVGLGSARAHARRVQCVSQLAQLSTGILLHEVSHNHLPTCGWGIQWTGLSDRGFGSRQPGGWIYNVLPFIEEGLLWQSAPKSTGLVSTEAFQEFVESVVPLFVCPERGGNVIISLAEGFSPRIGGPVDFGARTDFAVNSGRSCIYTRPGPETLSQADSDSYVWPDTRQCNGICFPRSQIEIREIKDGTNKVILCGEKWVMGLDLVPPDGGLNQPMIGGDCWDIRRVTDPVPSRDGEGGNLTSFGSAHADGAGFAFCDGSVRVIDYSVDPLIFHRLGGRNDGE